MLTQKTLSQLIADLWAMSASMNAACSAAELEMIDDVLYAPVRPEWLEKGAQALQKAAEDLESLLDDETPVERPPRTVEPILAIVRDEDEDDEGD